MNTVEPIREPRKIIAIKNLLRATSPGNYLLFTLGINLALRVSDLLSLKVKDVLDKKGEIVNSIYVGEQKTRKEKKMRLNKAAKEALEFYFSRPEVLKSTVANYDSGQYLFISNLSDRPLERIRVYQMINKWCEQVGLKGKYGTHTLRKTWGYMARKQGISIDLIQEKLGHRTPGVTRRYIGITQEEVNSKEINPNIIIPGYHE